MTGSGSRRSSPRSTSSAAGSRRRAGCSSSSSGANRLEPKLRALARDCRWVVPREARAAERRWRTSGRRLEPFEREVGKRRRADVLTHLVHRAVGGDQLVAVSEVDSVIALRDDRRRGDADVNLGRAGLEEHRDDLPRRVAPDDRVVDDNHALAVDFGKRIELQLYALLTKALVRLDEGPPDVAVLDQPFAEVDP